MGRVIKKDEQSDVESASLEEEDFRSEDVPPTSQSRIAAENVAPPDEPDRSSADASPKAPVLEDHQTHVSAEPVLVEPVAPEPDPPSPDTSAPDEAPDTETPPDDEPEADVPERTDAEWQEHLEEAVEEARAEGYEAGREDGYEAGYDEGYAEAETTLRAEWDEEREALIEDTRRFEEAWAQYLEEREPQLVELSLQLAKAIVDAPLADSLRRASEEALTEAVVELAGTPPLTITVHPVDFQRLQESGLAEQLTEKYDDLQLESDPECTEGDWSVASPAGVIRRRRSEVVETLRDHLSLSAPRSEDADE